MSKPKSKPKPKPDGRPEATPPTPEDLARLTQALIARIWEKLSVSDSRVLADLDESIVGTKKRLDSSLSAQDHAALTRAYTTLLETRTEIEQGQVIALMANLKPLLQLAEYLGSDRTENSETPVALPDYDTPAPVALEIQAKLDALLAEEG